MLPLTSFYKFPCQMSLNATVVCCPSLAQTSGLSEIWVDCTEHMKSSFSIPQSCLYLPLQDITSLEKTHTIHCRWKRQPFILGHFVHSTTTPGDQDHCPLPSMTRRMNGHVPLPVLAPQVGSTLTSNEGTYPKPNTERKTWSSQLPRALCISSWARW